MGQGYALRIALFFVVNEIKKWLGIVMKKIIYALLATCLAVSGAQATSKYDQERNGIRLVIKPLFTEVAFGKGEPVINEPVEVDGNRLKNQANVCAYRIGIINDSKKSVILDPTSSFRGIEVFSDYEKLGAKIFNKQGVALLVLGLIPLIPCAIGTEFYILDLLGSAQTMPASGPIALGSGAAMTGCFALAKLCGHSGIAQAFEQVSLTKPCIIPPKSQLNTIVFFDKNKSMSAMRVNVLLHKQANPNKIAANFAIDW